jgi:2-polyprenyl-3-methyl-5-hydroxy-6-metoxy-1,4-benzoquinol methylase
MANPWLEIPLSDYEQHMALPTVGQAQMLATELRAAVTAYSPRSIAVVGCAGGNGFDQLIATKLQRVVGIDINPKYIEVTRARFERSIHGLELYVANIEAGVPRVVPVDVVFAGLVLEYADVLKTMQSLQGLCNASGHVLIVMQLPNPAVTAISPSAYVSLSALSATMHLRDPDAVSKVAQSLGLTKRSERTLVLSSGKTFAALTFKQPDKN